MNHHDLLKRLVVERELKIDDFQYSSVCDWATNELATRDPHPLACELFERNCNIDATLIRIADERYEFSACSLEGDRFVCQITREYLTRFVAREISPLELCNYVRQIDSHYLDRLPDSHPTPDWAAALYNSCDWCNESWTHGNNPHLVEEARRVLLQLSAS